MENRESGVAGGGKPGIGVGKSGFAVGRWRGYPGAGIGGGDRKIEKSFKKSTSILMLC